MSIQFLYLRLTRRCVALLAVTTLLLLPGIAAVAAPGAHGPGGEHLDAPAQISGTGSNPRMETRSDLFELVAQLGGGELSILINRFASNEAVLGARVEVEVGAHKAAAEFHSDHGDYSVTDAAMLKALAAPGEHAMVFTVIAGKDSDLLDGTLTVAAAAPSQDHGHEHDDHLPDWVWAVLGVIGTLAVAVLALSRRRRRALPLAAGVRT